MEQSKEEKQSFLPHHLKHGWTSNQVKMSSLGEEYAIQPLCWENLSSMEKIKTQKT